MLEKFVALIKQTGALSLLAAGALLGSILTALVYHYQWQSQVDAHQAEYGQALAFMASQEAIDGSINQDLVSLQVVLSRIVRNPRAVAATIHDVENQLVVQAGKPPAPPFSESVYTAPILLDDAVAGLVTVFIQEPNEPLQVYWFICFSLSAFAALILVGLHWPLPWETSPSPDHSPLATHDTDTREATDNEETPPTSVYLTLSCSNLNQLKQQLNAEARYQLINKLHRNILRICKLYSGEPLPTADGRFVVRFTDNEPGDGTFSAICSAQLLLALNQQRNGLRLQLCSRITQPQDVSQLSQLEQTLMAQSELYGSHSYPMLVQQDLLKGKMAERFNWAETDIHGQVEITAVHQPYQQFLENQLKRLNEPAETE